MEFQPSYIFCIKRRIDPIDEVQEIYRGDPATGQDLAPYWKAEEKARAAKRGMWTQGDKYISPRDWRKMQREVVR